MSKKSVDGGKPVKKVAIVTLLDIANFGTMLQAYGLATTIRNIENPKWKYDVEFVNYWRKGYTTRDKVNIFLHDRSLGSPVKRAAFAMATLFFFAPIRRRIRGFVTQEFRFTRAFRSFDELCRAYGNTTQHNTTQHNTTQHNTTQHLYTADVFVSGSDQIWNSECNGGIDRAFFLDFTDSPRIAYAASMGIKEFPQGELEEARELLSKYRAISVRERQSMEYLHSIGFPGARHVIDPSLLLNSSDWARLAGSMQKKRKYLLVYSVERFNNDFIFSYAKEIAESLNLEMRVVCSTYPVKAEKYGFAKIHALADTRAFLRLYAGADFVVASSFHGMAFAVNFNKDFVVIAPDKYSVRMESLARQLSLSHRIVKGQKTPVSELKPIDWDWVNKRLSYERKRSMEFLQKALEDCCRPV